MLSKYQFVRAIATTINLFHSHDTLNKISVDSSESWRFTTLHGWLARNAVKPPTSLFASAAVIIVVMI